MWFYVQCVLIPYEKADAAAHDRPRGNLSDLYPRWLGARELLLHHRNPYSDDFTLEIQKEYYGRALDPARPDDPKDQQAFAYPVYVVFLLAPLIGFSFHSVHVFFYWLLAGLTAASVLLWLRIIMWRLPWLATAICIMLALGSFPAVQGIKLQQLTLLVAALLAAAAACATGGYFFCAGALLALATIKPQLAWPLVVWLLAWAASDWRTRRKLLFGFALVSTLLLTGAEVVLPGWWRMFAAAIGHYRQYTHSQPVLEVIAESSSRSHGGRIRGPHRRTNPRRTCRCRLCMGPLEVAAEAICHFRLRQRNSAGARLDCIGRAHVRALQSGSSLTRNSSAGARSQGICFAVAGSPVRVLDGRSHRELAVGREPWPDGNLFHAVANFGAPWLAVAVLRNICITRLGFRADLLSCAKRA